MLPAAKCRFRLVSTESSEILAESNEIDVVCPLSSVSLTFRSIVEGHETSGFSNLLFVVCCLLDAGF
jgi:hypothetical protein